jgi:hypothetical protein
MTSSGVTPFVTHPVLGRTTERRAALYDKLGPGTHRCHWCGARVTWKMRGALRRGEAKLFIDQDGKRPVPVCFRCKTLRAVTAEVET